MVIGAGSNCPPVASSSSVVSTDWLLRELLVKYALCGSDLKRAARRDDVRPVFHANCDVLRRSTTIGFCVTQCQPGAIFGLRSGKFLRIGFRAREMHVIVTQIVTFVTAAAIIRAFPCLVRTVSGTIFLGFDRNTHDHNSIRLSQFLRCGR